MLTKLVRRLRIAVFIISGNMFIVSGHGIPEKLTCFEFLELPYVKEVGIFCYFIEHIESGTTLLKIAKEDPDKIFSLAFRSIPETGHGFESGGLPEAMYNLICLEFNCCHFGFYHPENSFLMLYGNAYRIKGLAFLNENYLFQFTKHGNIVLIEDHQPLCNMGEFEAFFQAWKDAETTDQTCLSLNFVHKFRSKMAIFQAVSLPEDCLIYHEATPVKLAHENHIPII